MLPSEDNQPKPSSVRIDRVPGRDGRAIAVVAIDRPPVNAIDNSMKVELIRLAAEIRADGEIAAVVLSGGKHFAAGDDIKEMSALDRGFAARGEEKISEAISAVEAIEVPVVAAVSGFALGGGCELALAADFRIAAADSVWGLPEIHLGLIPGGGGTQRLPRLIGTAAAKRLIFLGDTLSAEAALDLGLVDEVVTPEQVLVRAISLADELTARAPLALRAAKRAINASAETTLTAGLRLETDLFGQVFATNDAEVGLTSFVEHGPRKASFSGS